MTVFTDVSDKLKREIHLYFHNERENAFVCLRDSMIGPEEHSQFIRSSTRIARTALRAVDFLAQSEYGKEIKDIGDINTLLSILCRDIVFKVPESSLARRVMLSSGDDVERQMKDIAFAAGVIRHNLCRAFKIDPCMSKHAVSKIKS